MRERPLASSSRSFEIHSDTSPFLRLEPPLRTYIYIYNNIRYTADEFPNPAAKSTKVLDPVGVILAPPVCEGTTPRPEKERRIQIYRASPGKLFHLHCCVPLSYRFPSINKKDRRK